MAEKKEKKEVKKHEEIDKEHDKSLTLMVGILIVLIATAAIAVACIYYLNNM